MMVDFIFGQKYREREQPLIPFRLQSENWVGVLEYYPPLPLPLSPIPYPSSPTIHMASGESCREILKRKQLLAWLAWTASHDEKHIKQILLYDTNEKYINLFL